MTHFYSKAKVLKTLGVDAPFKEIDDLLEKSAKWARRSWSSSMPRSRP
jgi:hypothetical protein